MAEAPSFLIYVDIDEVIYPWVNVACDMLSGYCGREICMPGHWVSQAEHLGLRDHEWQWLWTTAVDKGLHTLGKPIAGSVEALLDLRMSHRVELVTQRPPEAQRGTIAWLADHDLYPFDLHYLPGTPFKPAVPKSSVRPHAQFFVDDSPSVAYDILNETKTQMILFDRGHNRTVSHPSIVRALDWGEVVVYIEEAQEKEEARRSSGRTA
jgi:uncharacterized HAD superfamily protein